jgi:outer membrane protein assembly factor BamD (BamD/ComL family)
MRSIGAFLRYNVRYLLLAGGLGAAGCAATRPVPSAADLALLERGDMALAAKEYAPAIEYYRELLQQFPESPYADDAQFKIGFTYVCYRNPAMDYQRALLEFKILADKYPHSNWLYEANNWVRALETLVRYQISVISQAAPAAAETEHKVKPPKPEIKYTKKQVEELENKLTDLATANARLAGENEKLKAVLKKLEALDK